MMMWGDLMQTKMRSISFFIYILLIWIFSVASFADGGKVFILQIPKDESALETEEKSSDVLAEQLQVANNDEATNTNYPADCVPPLRVAYDEDFIVDVPPPSATYSHESLVKGELRGMIQTVEQNIVIAWNGKTDADGEEILILNTLDQSDITSPVLTILPLPGQPLSISHVAINDPAPFINSKALLIKKWDASFGSGHHNFPSSERAIHSAWVWKIEDIPSFEQSLHHYLVSCYNGKAAPFITKEALDVVRNYFDRGFRYFAFDLSLVHEDRFTSKEAIVYHFRSKSVYFPLVISKIGGTGKTRVDMVILTPGNLTRSPFYQIGTKDNDFQGPAQLLGNGTVDLSKEEFSALDKSIAEFFKSYNTIKARNIQISGQINSFDNDFLMDNRLPAPPSEQPADPKMLSDQ